MTHPCCLYNSTFFYIAQIVVLGLGTRCPHGVVVLRKLMQRKDLRLENESQETNSLVDAFNSDISSEEFLSKIEKTAAEDSKVYNELIDIIIGQDL